MPLRPDSTPSGPAEQARVVDAFVSLYFRHATLSALCFVATKYSLSTSPLLLVNVHIDRAQRPSGLWRDVDHIRDTRAGALGGPPLTTRPWAPPTTSSSSLNLSPEIIEFVGAHRHPYTHTTQYSPPIHPLYEDLLRTVSTHTLPADSSWEYPVMFARLDTPRLRSPTLAREFVDWAEVCAGSSHASQAFGILEDYLGECENLRCLTVCAKKTSAPTLRMFLRAIPKLESLDLELGEEDRLDGLVHMLTLPTVKSDGSPADQDDCVVPNLRTLILTIHKPLDPSVLARLLQSRRVCAPSNQLYKLVLYSVNAKVLRGGYPYMSTIRAWLATSDNTINEGGLDLQFEKHCIPERTLPALAWMDRSPDFEDWREAVELMNARK